MQAQLSDLAGLLRADVLRVKSEFRRLNLALSFTPTDAAPRPHYVVIGQCDLSALAFFLVLQPNRPIGGAERARPFAWVRFWTTWGGKRSTAAPQFYWRFLVTLPSVEARGRWRERGKFPAPTQPGRVRGC